MALIPQLVLIPLQFMPMLAPVGVMLSLMPGRMRPYWTVPVSRAVVLLPGASCSVTSPALMFTATWPSCTGIA